MAYTFDKLCIVIAVSFGIIFMILGIIGIFFCNSANFTLPPILGVIPFFPGFAMCVCLIKFWKLSNKLKTNNEASHT